MNKFDDDNVVIIGEIEELTEHQQSKLYPLTNFKQFFRLSASLIGKSNIRLLTTIVVILVLVEILKILNLPLSQKYFISFL